MYKVLYYPTITETSVSIKWFGTLKEAVAFANDKPMNSILEIKYYDDVDHRKPDRN